MRKFNRLAVVLCLTFCAAFAVLACGGSITPLKFSSVDGYPAAEADKTAKTISVQVAVDVAVFDLNKIKFNKPIEIEAYAEADRESKLDNLNLIHGENTFYLVVVFGTLSENWTLIVHRSLPAKTVKAISVAEFDTIYNVGDGFKGGWLNVTYDDNEQIRVLITSTMVNGFDTTTVGSREITISYAVYIAKITINVLGDLTPTTLDIEELQEEIHTIISGVYLALGAPSAPPNILDGIFDGDTEALHNASITVVDALQTAAMTKAEVEDLAGLFEELIELHGDIRHDIDSFVGEGNVIEHSKIIRLKTLFNKFTTLVNPIRAAKFFAVYASYNQSKSSGYEYFDYDTAITAAAAFPDIQAALTAQKAKTDYSTEFTRLFPSEREAVKYFSDYYRYKGILWSKDTNVLMRLINLKHQSNQSFFYLPDGTSTAQLASDLSVLGDMFLEINAANWGNRNWYSFTALDFGVKILDLQPKDLGLSFTPQGIGIHEIIVSDANYKGNFFKSFDASTLTAMNNITTEMNTAESTEAERLGAKLFVYHAKALKGMLSRLTDIPHITFYTDYNSFINSQYRAYPDTKKMVDKIIATAAFDAESMTGEQLSQVLDLNDNYANSVRRIRFGADLGLVAGGFSPVPVEKGTTAEEFLTILSRPNAHPIFVYVDNGSAIDSVQVSYDDVTIHSFDASETGLFNFTIEVKMETDGFVFDASYYVYDENSASEFILLANQSIVDYTQPSFALNATDTKLEDAVYDLCFYNIRYGFVIKFWQELDNAELYVDTSSEGQKIGFIKADVPVIVEYYLAVDCEVGTN